MLTAFVLLNANKNMHNKMLESILKAPIKYYDQTPSGRIINKFSNDIGLMDTALLINFIDMI